jgi:hypothetical protein
MTEKINAQKFNLKSAARTRRKRKDDIEMDLQKIGFEYMA